MKLRAFLVGFIAFLAACSAKDNPDPYATVPEFCAAWGKAACNAKVVSQCSGTTTTSTLTEKCVLSQQTFCATLVPEASYRSAEAQRCLDAVGAAYANANLDGPELTTVRHLGAPCNHLIKAPAALGESCTQDSDCNTVQSNVRCVAKRGVGFCAVATLVANGTSCTSPTAACMPGFYCDGDNCVQPHKVDGSCSADFECENALTCDTAISKCATRVDPSMCTADADCTSAACDITGTSTDGACVDSITLAHAEAICGDLR